MKNLKNNSNKILLIGIGNNGLGDDGLGWKFVEWADGLGYDFLDYEFRNQLQVEDASLISNYNLVVFVDASHEKLSGGFELKSCIPANQAFFSTHEQVPGAILYLTNHLYNKFPKAYTMAISGKDWDIQSSLSFEAKNNLQSAISFFAESFLPSILPRVVYN